MTTEEKVLSLDDINRQYDGQWVLVRVVTTERDKLIDGAVLASDADREKIAAMLPRSQEQQPRPTLAFFRASAQ